MDCIILAGGLGTRLRESVPHLPKPLAPINGSAFLTILLKQLTQMPELTKAVLAISYKASLIINFFEKNPAPLPLAFSVEETPLGTGGALKKALSQTTSEYVLALNGDSYLAFSLSTLLEKQKKHNADIVLACIEVEDASRYGKLQIDEKDGRIESFHEKSQRKERGFVNAGVYLMKRSLLDSFASETVFSLEKDVFPQLTEKKMYTCKMNGTFIDIGTPNSFAIAQSLLHEESK